MTGLHLLFYYLHHGVSDHVKFARGLYHIRSLLTCPSGPMCTAELTVQDTGAQPQVRASRDASMEWELIPQGDDLYVIRSRWGCPGSEHCGGELSLARETSGFRRVWVTVGSADTVLWMIKPRGTGYVIQSESDLDLFPYGVDRGRAVLDGTKSNWAIIKSS